MATDWSKKIMKYFIIIINTIVFLAGLCLAGVAGYAAFNKNSLLHQLAVDLQAEFAITGLYILLAVGLIMALLSLVGCIGAARESRALLGIYFFFVLLILILEIAAIILCFTKLKAFETQVLKALKAKSSITNTNITAMGTQETLALLIKGVLPRIEETKHCCGLHGPEDYGLKNSIPDSCYTPVTGNIASKPIGIVGDEEPAGGNSELERQNQPGSQGGPSPGGSSSTLTTTTTTTTVSTTTPASNQRMLQASPATTTPSNQGSVETTTSTEPVPPVATHAATTAPSVVIDQTTLATRTTIAESTTSSSASPSHIHGPLYFKGCLSILSPMFYAAGGIAIGILLLELLLLLFTGLLLAGMHGGYKSLA